MTDDTCGMIAIAVLNVVATIVLIANPKILDKLQAIGKSPTPRGWWVLPLFFLLIFIIGALTPALSIAYGWQSFKECGKSDD